MIVSLPGAKRRTILRPNDMGGNPTQTGGNPVQLDAAAASPVRPEARGTTFAEQYPSHNQQTRPAGTPSGHRGQISGRGVGSLAEKLRTLDLKKERRPVNISF